MIVCIFGPSCVGKTAVSRLAAAALVLPLRSCGNAVRKMSESLGRPIDQLPDEAHRGVDAETIEWAMGHPLGCILDGRFLDAVFAAAGVPAALIELRADRCCRVERARVRNSGSNFSADDLDRMDSEDAGFRERMFGRLDSDVPRTVLDTSGRTVDECARRVEEIVKAWFLRRENPRA